MSAPRPDGDASPHEHEENDLFAALPAPTLPPALPEDAALRLGPVPRPAQHDEATALGAPEALPPALPAPPALAVVRSAPTPDEHGLVDGLVEAITITFNQPMVPLASLEDLSAYPPPMRLSPQPPGRFRWLGTATIAFVPEGRLPLATSYTVTVPAGTESTLGRVLPQEFQFRFSTARPALVASIPAQGSQSVRPQGPFGLLFSARVLPEDVLPHLRLEEGLLFKKRHALRLVPPPRQEERALPLYARLNRDWEAERVVWVAPLTPLPLDTSFSLVLDESLRCEEGPLPLGSAIKLAFSTYGPLAIKKLHRPSYPGAAIIETSQPLASQSLTEVVTLHPPVENLHLQVNGASIVLHGDFVPRHEYEVTVGAGLRDTFGQTLEKAWSKRFRVGKAAAFVEWIGIASGVQTVLEAKGPRQLPFRAVNAGQSSVEVASFSSPEEIERALRAIEKANLSWSDGVKDFVARSGFAFRALSPVSMAASPDEPVYGAVPLAPLGSADQLALVHLHTPSLKQQGNHRVLAVVQLTDLGISAAISDDEVVARVVRLSDGSPVVGAQLSFLRPNSPRAETDAEGVARLPGARALEAAYGENLYLYAASGEERAFVNIFARQHSRTPNEPVTVGSIYTARGIYKPGESVQCHVIARPRARGPQGELLPATANKYSWIAVDAQGKSFAVGRRNVWSPFGTGTFTVDLPRDVACGEATIVVSSAWGGPVIEGTFEIQEYRTPEHKTEVRIEGAPHLLGETVNVVVSGSYFIGAPLDGAPVTWRLQRSPSQAVPPKNGEFSFSELPRETSWHGRWGGGHPRVPAFGRYAVGVFQSNAPAPELLTKGQGTLDASGELSFPITLEAGAAPGPWTFTLEAEVTDKNQQVIAARSTVTAHPSSLLVGLRLVRTVVQVGEEIELSLVVVTREGTRHAGHRVRLSLHQEHWEDETLDGDAGTSSSHTRREREVWQGEATSEDGPLTVRIPAAPAGSWVVRATVAAPGGRTASASCPLYIFGANQAARSTNARLVVDLQPERSSYEAGEVARILVRSPFAASRGFLLLSREGIVDAIPLSLDSSSALVEVPLPERLLPRAEISALLASCRDAASADDPDDRGRPQVAEGSLSLPLGGRARRLSVEISASSSVLAPGEEVALEVVVRRPDGSPAAANVMLAVVDEGALSLINYQTPDPFVHLYPEVSPETLFNDGRKALIPRRRAPHRPSGSFGPEYQALTPQAATMMLPAAPRKRRGGYRLGEVATAPLAVAAAVVGAFRSAAGAGADAAADDEPPEPSFAVREFFAATAFFHGGLVTDEQGTVRARVKMPDNLSEFRVIALASELGQCVGAADHALRVRRPLVLRPAVPRFLNLGDEFQASVVVHNETGAQAEIEILARGVNLAFSGAARLRVSLAHGEVREVSFAARPLEAGPARFQFAAVALSARRETDAAEVTVPVLVPATAEAFATYGSTEGSAAHPLVVPAGALPSFGGLEIELSSSALSSLQDAAAYLLAYPHECLEQRASRVVGLIAASELLGRVRLEGLADEEARHARLVEVLSQLERHQRPDGGFSYWEGGDKGFWARLRGSSLYPSVFASLALALAAEVGEHTKMDSLGRAETFLARRLDHPLDEWEKRDYASQVTACLVLALRGRTPAGHLDRLFGKRKQLPLFAKAQLWEAIFRTCGASDARISSLWSEISNAATETAGTAHFAEEKTESLRLLLHSEERTDAIVLGALLTVRPGDPLVEKVARGLLRQQRAGRWSTTQANAYALLSLLRYLREREREEPEFDARAWCGEDYLGGYHFAGRGVARASLTAPMRTLQDGANARSIVLAKDGPGRLYYRLGLRYAPANLRLPPEEQGFVVSRLYERESGGPLARGEDGILTLARGEYLRVRVQVIVPGRRCFVAVVDPLPAGLEVVNTRFVTSATQRLGTPSTERTDVRPWWLWWLDLRTWDHEEMRDDRVQLFAGALEPGVYEYVYAARATTEGLFFAPPPRAEEMYAPETFGRGAGELLRVRGPRASS